MTTLHETAYPHLKPDLTERELAELYTPTEAERVLVAGVGKRPLPRVAALIHLKVFQRLGYFLALADVPQVIREHVAQHAVFCGRQRWRTSSALRPQARAWWSSQHCAAT